MQVVCILQASKLKKQTPSLMRNRTYSNLSSLCLHRTTIYHLDKEKSVSLRPYNYIAIILSVISRVLEIPFCRNTRAEQKFPGGLYTYFYSHIDENSIGCLCWNPSSWGFDTCTDLFCCICPLGKKFSLPEDKAGRYKQRLWLTNTGMMTGRAINPKAAFPSGPRYHHTKGMAGPKQWSRNKKILHRDELGYSFLEAHFNSH